jgi:hypothetical protein
MKKFLKTFLYFGNIFLIYFFLLVPFLVFLNRFLIPDVSYDSLNYHLFLGQRGVDLRNVKYEFYPTGLHNFSSIFEIPGYVFMRIFGYRLGSITSLIFLYLSIIILYKIFRLYQPKFKIKDNWWWGLMFGSIFLSFEAFLQLSIYFVDIQVAFFMLLGCYFLFKYEKSKSKKDLVWSLISISILLLGKMSAGYILPAYFLYILIIFKSKKELTWKYRIKNIFLCGIFVMLFSIPWWYQNYRNTNNPIFPYFNKIFKSEFYSNNNYSQESSGGNSTIEKLFWGIYSIREPSRLGQAHDLFHDYKINIYFVIIIFIFLYSWKIKDKDLLKLSSFYLISYEVWAWVFGYLRYGIGLEFLGGIILLLWVSKMKNMHKYLILLPLLAIMILQGKRVINLSLAYDLGFRSGYFYNKQSYISEKNKVFKNLIDIDKSLIEKYTPQVYLNCTVPGLSYMVLSDFSKLPVFNIDREFYIEMTENKSYIERSRKMLREYNSGEKLRFVTITANSGLNTTYDQCKKNLADRKFKILDEYQTNFLGYENQKLKVIFGEFSW